MTKNDLMKRHLCETFMDLCEENDISKISVTKLVESAHVARATFYNNFHDISDLINYIGVRYFVNESTPLFEPANVRRTFLFASQHKGFYSQLPRHMGQNNFRETFTAWNEKLLSRIFIPVNLSEEERLYRKLCIDMHCIGTVGLFLNWCSSGMQTPVDALVRAIADTTPDFMRTDLESTPVSMDDPRIELPE